MEMKLGLWCEWEMMMVMMKCGIDLGMNLGWWNMIEWNETKRNTGHWTMLKSAISVWRITFQWRIRVQCFFLTLLVVTKRSDSARLNALWLNDWWTHWCSMVVTPARRCELELWGWVGLGWLHIPTNQASQTQKDPTNYVDVCVDFAWRWMWCVCVDCVYFPLYIIMLPCHVPISKPNPPFSPPFPVPRSPDDMI